MRKLLKYAFATAALVAIASPRGIGAIHSVTAKLDSATLLMGNTTTLHIQAVADESDGQLQLADDTITSAIEYRSIDYKGATSLDDGTHRLDYDITIQSFDSGPHVIPPIPFISGVDTAYSNPLELTVSVPLDADSITDVTEATVDVLEPENVEWTDDLPDSVAKAIQYWPWILAGLLLVILGVAIALYLRRRRRHKAEDKEAQLPPYQWAMLKLSELRERNLFASGQNRLYYTDLTEILRVYLMRRFDINAMEMTSSQIIAALPAHEMGIKEGKPLLKKVLRQADFVKFAKLTPSTDENILTFNNAVKFVELTRPVLPSPESGTLAKADDSTTSGAQTPESPLNSPIDK